MNATDWTGFAGVALLLVAYFLNATDRIHKDGLLYISMNISGAAIACLASILLAYWPFIILEGAWTAVSVFALFQYLKKSNHKSPV